MAKITGIDHINILVPDVDAAVKFYCEGLGLKLARKDETNAITVTPDGVILELSPGGTGSWDSSGITHVCYKTCNVDASFRRALEYGAVISRPKDPEPYTYKDLRMAFVRAPSGEEIEFWSIAKNGVFGEACPDSHYITHFVHAAFTVPDMKSCVDFYTQLGAKPKVDWEWGCSMSLPDGRELEFFTGGEYAKEPSAYRHLALLTDDAYGMEKKVKALGGKITHECYDWSNLRIFFCTGLAGEVIEFFQFFDDRKPDIFENIPQKLELW
jgi:catechol 2,3-dioxygenase-like lactoylglutathione lyase family enzyme